MLVHFLQSLLLLLLLGFLLVEIFVGELLEVLRVNLLHDEVQAARCNEIADVAWIARQIFKRSNPVDQRILDRWTVSEWVLINPQMLGQSAHAEAILALALLITQLYLDNFRLTHGHHVAGMAIHLQLTHAAGKRLMILRHVYETTSSFLVSSP